MADPSQPPHPGPDEIVLSAPAAGNCAVPWSTAAPVAPPR
jgi:hypothetical protein